MANWNLGNPANGYGKSECKREVMGFELSDTIDVRFKLIVLIFGIENTNY